MSVPVRLPAVLTQLACVVTFVALSGCSLMSRRSRVQQSVQRCLPPTATVDDIVCEVNRNILGDGSVPGLASWRSDNVRVSRSGMPGSLSASLAVEAPRGLRVQVAAPFGGSMMDLGSNGEEYWLWSKDADPNALMVGQHGCAMHPHLAEVMPFEPDWLLDVLGVVPMSPEGVRMTSSGDTAELITRHHLANGNDVEKVKKVSLVTGEILQHELRDIGGRTIAQAEVVRSFRDPASRLLLPGEVRVRWPDYGQGMTLKISDHVVNPPSIRRATFQKPMRPHYRTVALTRPAVPSPTGPVYADLGGSIPPPQDGLSFSVESESTAPADSQTAVVNLSELASPENRPTEVLQPRARPAASPSQTAGEVNPFLDPSSTF